ncbi:hypothetical protein AXE80_10810 [Wenyingzhuangia fucanilytica]|uniref:Peptidase S49 domain-containing protein n=1 Tax=Wenyingzhuangia fucanilytica TaxID=1790137 RepID=A0A1B1Y7M5_9FLAO|nr:S49 family peptidase [Wenyingzhuangia fucanilytica]ANW96734.1 hypothetical protein AXE80_10810 [Wenyingzhuangia fucanilytica]
MSENKNLLAFTEWKWAVSPEAFLAFKPYFNFLINGSAAVSDIHQKIEARYVRSVIDGSGNERGYSAEEPVADAIGVVRITGPIIKYGNWYMWGADELVAMLHAFDKDPNIRAIVIVIDSGGGMVSAAAPFKDFYAQKTKPVITIGDTCASLAVWLRCGADYNFADNDISAQFGSIGIVANFMSFKKYYEELGIKEHVIYSTHSEDKNKGFDMAMEGKYDLIKEEHLDPLALKFRAHVTASLPNLKTDTPGLLTGKMFYADDSLDIGLVHEIGNLNQAINKAHDLADQYEAKQIQNRFNN